MFDLVASLLSWFYNLNSSYAVAIGLLTLVVLVITTPFTLKGTSSMLKMQIMQPELKKIQDKYDKDEREEMNAELMAFYKDNNINPVGGCFPMLIQIPVFLVLYRVIIGLTRRGTDLGAQSGSTAGSIIGGTDPVVIEGVGESNFNPAWLEESSELFQDLSSTNEMNSVGLDLARSASQALGDGITTSLPYLFLVLIVFISGWFQHQMIRRRQSGAPVNPTQEMIMKFMPYFLPVFSFTLPAAIVIYFFISNLYRIGQQYYITRSMYSGEDSLGAQVRAARESQPKDSKNSGAKDGAKKQTGKSASAKSGSKSATSTKKKSSNKAKGGAPGRNTSGIQSSARAQVQPKARKKKKR